MTYERWTLLISKKGYSPSEARKLMGLSYTSLRNWRLSNKVGPRGEIFVKSLDRKLTSESVLNERHGEYGSFDTNMKNLITYKNAIDITVDFYHDNDELIFSTVEFGRNMLALKAVRSLHPTISEDRYIDCVIDFINYYKLLSNHFNKWGCKFSIEFKPPFKFKTLPIDVELDDLYKGEKNVFK